MRYNKLGGEVKVFIVQNLACFLAPSEVARAVKSEFGVIVTPQSVEAYDPHKRHGSRLSLKWRQLYADTRKAFLEETSRIGISHRAVRLRRLEQQYEMAAERGDSATILKLLEQAAKEMGGLYIRRGAPAETMGGPAGLKRPIDHRERAKAILLKLARARMLREGQGG